MQLCTDDYFEYEQGDKPIRVRGRLKTHLQFWKDISTRPSLLWILEHGYNLPLFQVPPQAHFRNNQSAKVQSDFVTSAITDLLVIGSIKIVSTKPWVVNPLSVSVQKSGKKRLILDLRFVNQYLWKNKITFEGQSVLKQYLEPNCYIYTFDICQAYHHIEVLPAHQTYLGFSWLYKGQLQYFVFTVVPFGLSSAPYIFTKLTRELVGWWRKQGLKIVLFLDDGAGTNKSLEACKIESHKVRTDIIASGFVPHKDKCIWLPVQIALWLGFIWNVRTFCLEIPEDKITRAVSQIDAILNSQHSVSARTLSKVTGILISFSPVIGNIARLLTRYLHYAINVRDSWDKRMNISNTPCITELQFWRQNLSCIKKGSLGSVTKEANILGFSDASNYAAGSYIVSCGTAVAHHMWDDFEREQSSTWRELKALEIALHSFESKVAGKVVKWYTDCKNVAHVVHVGSMKPGLQSLAISIFTFCLQHNISLELEWIPRSLNDKADSISRIYDTDTWETSNDFYSFVDNLFGPHTFDRFASSENAKIPRFNSKFWCPGTSGIDAFAFNWSGDNNWLVPPIKEVCRTIHHLLTCQGQGTLITPKWPAQAFWPLLATGDKSWQPYVSDVLQFNQSNNILVRGPAKRCALGTNNFTSPVMVFRIDGRLVQS